MTARRESRPYAKIRQGAAYVGHNVEFVTCPFCETEVKTYRWSRYGSGKRCQCGGLLCGIAALAPAGRAAG